MKIRKSKLFVVLTMIAILMFMQMSVIISDVKAEVITGSEGDVSWSFDSESGTLTFSGSGKISSVWKKIITSYRECVKNIVIAGTEITSIGNAGFSDCYALASITIPNSVTSIGNTAFSNCISLTNITIPNNVTDIGTHAFSDCKNLTSITIPDSVTNIGSYVFSNCISLTSITVESSNSNYKDIDGVLFNKQGTTLIQYPIGKKEETYTIPDGVTVIGPYAFVDCKSLTNITIPDSVTNMYVGSFCNCNNLKSIKIPNSVTSIERGVFDNCWNLTSIIVEKSNLNYKDIDGVLFNKQGTTILQYPIGKNAESYTVPNGVTIIGQDAFQDCESLTSVTISDSVTIIGPVAFYDCDSLTSITIPGSVTSIGNMAFDDCDSLTSITIPNSVTSIGDNVFDNCSSLTIYCTTNSYAKTYAEEKNIPYIIDDTAPTIDVSYKDGTITITATDSGVGLANEEFSLDNKEWCASNEFPVDKSGTYTVYARDKLGNIATKEIEVIVEEQDVVDEDKNDEKNETEDNKTTIEESDKTTNDEDNKTNTQEDTNKKPTNIKDGSESPDPFGQYGNKTIISLVIILVIISLIAYSKFKKYNIKD